MPHYYDNTGNFFDNEMIKEIDEVIWWFIENGPPIEPSRMCRYYKDIWITSKNESVIIQEKYKQKFLTMIGYLLAIYIKEEPV